MRRRAFLAGLAGALSVPRLAGAQRTVRGVEIPVENDQRAEHRARPPAGDAAERAEQLFGAIQADDPESARGFFFPQEPFRVLKGIADPDRYWNVLLRHYERDIHALHEEIPAEASFDRLVMTRRGGWVEPRQEANALPYWASRHDWVYYRVGEVERRFEIRTLINWGPRWYVTHLT